MQTKFTAEQLADPETAQRKILRTCVHCGFCTATCPTYVLLGDELDSPRGRIYLIKQMLESGAPADAEDASSTSTAASSCLSCMTTCPSGVNYMHLVDHAPRLHRAHLPATAGRPAAALAARRASCPIPAASGRRSLGARGRPAASPACCRAAARRAARDAGTGAGAHPPRAHRSIGRRSSRPRARAAARVALLTGCAQQVLRRRSTRRRSAC